MTVSEGLCPSETYVKTLKLDEGLFFLTVNLFLFSTEIGFKDVFPLQTEQQALS